MDTLPNNYQHFFGIPKSVKEECRQYYHSYYIAFDAEWYEVAGENVVISYQIATCSKNKVNNIIKYMDPGQRLSLAEIIELGIRSVNDGQIPEFHAHPKSKTYVHMISHHVTAEWSVLADRQSQHITNSLTVIRKSPVTGHFGIWEYIGDRIKVAVFIDDTRLIAPATHQKLSDLSKLLGSDDDLKIDVEHYYKKRMNLLLRDDPVKYEAYALQDSIITLKLYFLLQDSLGNLANSGRLFKTLASAAVTGYFVSYGNYRSYQRVLNTWHYADAYKLIKRGYFGGRNEGYFVGDSDDYVDLFGKRVWVDIDFVGCYPTAMALCPTIDTGLLTSPFDPPLSSRKLDAIIDSLKVKLDIIPVSYRLDAMSNEQLRDAGIPVEAYQTAKSILDKLSAADHAKAQDEIFKEFDEYLRKLPKLKKEYRTEHARKIRAISQCKNNSHLDRWYKLWKAARKRKGAALDHYITPGFARVYFKFPQDTQFPCLSVFHRQYGLIYPLEGETVATASELMLALDAGAEIQVFTSLEMKTLKYRRVPKRHFFDHLANLTKKRADYKKTSKDKSLSEPERCKAQVLERLTKEFLNSFYGKSAQAINYRKTYQVDTGEMRPLGQSKLSEACAAALTTGLARAALGAVLLAIQEYNKGKHIKQQLIVVSATTDGLLVGLPRPDGFSTADYYEMGDKGLEIPGKLSQVEPILKKCKCNGLWKSINAHLPIRQMRTSRRELTGGDDTFLEIKNMADRIYGVKTRGQIGWINYHGVEKATILAKFGHKPPLTDIIAEKYPQLSKREQEEEYKKIYDGFTMDRNTMEAEWIMEQISKIKPDEEALFDYPFYGLTSFNDMIKSKDHLDLVQKNGFRRFNADFDWKRKLELVDGIIYPCSKPYQNITEMLAHRHQMQNERRWGRNARPVKVLQRHDLKNSRVRMRSGDAATVVRLFLRGIRHQHIPCSQPRKLTGAETVARIKQVWTDSGFKFEQMVAKGKGVEAPVRKVKREWTVDDVKNAGVVKRWERGVIIPSPRLEKLLEGLAIAFGADPEQAKDEIFAKGLDKKVSKDLAFYVVQSVLQAPDLGIKPFTDLYIRGLLPDKAGIANLLHPHITDHDVIEAGRKPFLTGQCWSSDQPELVRLFRTLKFSVKDAETCARLLAPSQQVKEKVPRNPAVNKCMESFVHAILQPDIVQQAVAPIKVFDKLRWYGLKRYRYYSLRRSKFIPNSLSNTPENRRQINKMAESLGLDPVPIMDALLDK